VTSTTEHNGKNHASKTVKWRAHRLNSSSGLYCRSCSHTGDTNTTMPETTAQPHRARQTNRSKDKENQNVSGAQRSTEQHRRTGEVEHNDQVVDAAEELPVRLALRFRKRDTVLKVLQQLASQNSLAWGQDGQQRQGPLTCDCFSTLARSMRFSFSAYSSLRASSSGGKPAADVGVGPLEPPGAACAGNGGRTGMGNGPERPASNPLNADDDGPATAPPETPGAGCTGPLGYETGAGWECGRVSGASGAAAGAGALVWRNVTLCAG
jgi:hypothetical protein